MYKRNILLLVMVLLLHDALAQSVLRFQHLNVEDGLSQSSVNQIFQDSHGFIWFATGDGLNRYDGKQFISYKSRFNDTLSGSMKDRNINSTLLEDKFNRLWFASDAGVSYLDTRTGKFNVIVDKYTTACSSFISSMDSTTVWISIPHKGIGSTNLRTLKTTYYTFKDSGQMGPYINTISNTTATTTGIWIADKTGLIYFDKQTKKETRKLIKAGITSVNILHNGNLLLTSINAAYLFNTQNDSLQVIGIKGPVSGKDVIWTTFAEDTLSDIVYLGARSGGTLCKLDISRNKHELLHFQNSKINNLFIDRSAHLWVGTDGDGVYKLTIGKPRFYSFGPVSLHEETDQKTFFVKSIYRDDSGKIWMGVFNNGLFTYDPASGRQEKIPIAESYDDQLISSIIKDSSGSMVVTIGGTVVWLDAGSKKITGKTKLLPILEMSPATPIVYSFIEWKKGHYFAGTNIGIYSIVHENGITRSWMPASFRNDSIITGWPYNFHKAADGYIYVGLRRGFCKIRAVSDSQIHVADFGFREIPIRHFYKSPATPILWIASEQGLIAYNEHTKHYKVFDERAGLANSFVYAILAQNDTSLWISTNSGLSGVKVRYTGTADVEATVTNYTMKDGLQSNEFNTGAYFKDPRGVLYFGGIAGINWFDPAEMKINLTEPQPAISEIFINDKLYAGDTAIYVNNLTLPYSHNTVSFSLSSLEFTKQGQSLFSYKLDGLDKEWVYTTSDHVRYPNLQPGTYLFLLRVSNSDGIWNEHPIQLSVTILPPYWQTWWFRAIIAVLALAIIYLSARYYIKQKVRIKTRALEKQQALYMERLRISKDVHDDLGSGLSKISLMAALAQKKVTDDANLGKDIKHISQVSKELVDNMRDLIWVLNPENTSLEQLVSRLREYCADYLEHMPITMRLHFPDQVPTIRISSEAQRNIFLTVKEAINNCIKHADASEITVSLTLPGATLDILIADNGRGFDIDQLKGGGNGLRNMRQRIESIGGNFTITSAPNKNTGIRLSISFADLCAEKIPL